ncbi:MAG: hypothetical protein WC175_04950, partial [Candidatus Dojkabacteria bacterium]
QLLTAELDEALVIKKKEAEEERKALDELEEWKSYFNETMSVLDIINEEYKLALCDRMIGSLMALYSKSLRKLSIRQVKTLVSTVTTYDLQEREKSFLISTLVNLRLERLKDTEISEIVSAYNVIMAPYAKSEDINRVILDDLKIKLLDQIERVIYEGSFENLLMGITSTYEPDMLATLMEAENLYDKCWFVITDVLKREISEDEIIDNLINHVMMSNPTDDMTYSLRFLRVPINSEKSIEKIVSETPSSEYETFIDFTESDPSWRASQKEIMDRLSLNGFNYLTTKYYSLDHDIYGMKSSDEFIRLFSFLNGHTKYCLDGTLENILKVNMTDISTEPISILDVLVGLQYIIFKIHGMSSVTIPNSEEDYKYPTLHLGSEDVTVNLAALCNMSGNAEYLQNTISNFDSVVSGFKTAQTLYDEIQVAGSYEAARDILISKVKEMEFSEEAMNTLLINVKEYDEYKDKLKKYRDMFLSGTVSDVFSTLSGYSTYDEYCLTELPDFISWLEEGKPEDIEHDTDYYKQKFITFYNYLIDAIEDKEFSRRFKNSFYYDTIKQILTQILRYFQSYTITMQDIITYLRIDQPLQNNTKLTDEMIRSTDLSISERLTVNNLSFTTRLPKFKQYTHSLTLDDGVALEIRLDDETVPPISILDKSRIPLNRYKINKWK